MTCFELILCSQPMPLDTTHLQPPVNHFILLSFALIRDARISGSTTKKCRMDRPAQSLATQQKSLCLLYKLPELSSFCFSHRYIG